MMEKQLENEHMDELDLKCEENFVVRSSFVWLLFCSGSSSSRGTLLNVLIGGAA